MANTKVPVELLDLDSGITISTADNSTQLTLTSTDADSSAGPVMEFYRNSGSPADNDAAGLIYFTGENDADEKVFYGQIYTQIKDASDGTEDASIDFISMVGGTGRSRMYLAPTETVFNEASVDLDFRVESNGNTNTLWVDGGNDDVLMGNTTVTPASGHSDQAGFGYQSEGVVEIANTNNAATLVIGKNQGTDGSFIDFRKEGANVGSISVLGGNNLTISGIQTNHCGFSFATNAILPATQAATNNNTVDLGANGNAYKDVYVGGNIYIGGTGSANALDDYEEGSWTPVIKDGSTTVTVTVDQATYTKVGRFIMVTAMVTRNDTGSYTNPLQITGLPFAVKTGDTNISGGVWFDGTGTDTVTNCYIPGGSSTAYPKKVGDNSAYATTDDFEQGRPFYMSGMYHTT